MLNVKSCESLCSTVALLHHHQKGKKKTFVGVNGCEQQLLKVSKGTALIMWDAEKNKEAFFSVFWGVGFHYLLVPSCFALSGSFISRLAFWVTFKVK